MSDFTLDSFRKKYSSEETPDIVDMFMRISAKKWLEYITEKSGGKFRPDIERILRFSDADSDYEYCSCCSCGGVNENVTIGEMLRIADEMCMNALTECPEFAFESRQDASYIVNNLVVYPFADFSDESTPVLPPPVLHYYDMFGEEEFDEDDEEEFDEDDEEEFDEDDEEEFDDEDEEDNSDNGNAIDPIPPVENYPWGRADLSSLLHPDYPWNRAKGSVNGRKGN